MKINSIVNLVNQSLAGERLSYAELIPYLNNVIDEINTTLNSNYPVFELDASGTTLSEYNFFPDRYIRTVLVTGAVWFFYTVDEEGAQAAPMFQLQYKQALFYMLRDWSYNIPEEYRADYNQGSIVSDFNMDRGLEVNGSDFII